MALTVLRTPLLLPLRCCPLQKLVLPLAKQLLAEVWSPYSRRQSVAAAAMLADFLVYVPTEDEALQVGLGLWRCAAHACCAGMQLLGWCCIWATYLCC
jgi:GC-rich sequence DNA-binding factor